MSQMPLPLPPGSHVGPLFVARLQRPPVRPKGKEGVVHRAQTVRATPRWLTDEQKVEMRRLYAWAKRLTAWHGELYVVDHIVPKIGKTVCGLHCPWNLRVIHWRENVLKGAHTWPGMPNEQMDLLEVCDG